MSIFPEKIKVFENIIDLFRDDRQAYLNLQSDCKELNGKITKLDGQCSVEMVKRFGEGVSMQDIESFAVNRTLEEMKELSKRKEQSLYDTINDSKVSESRKSERHQKILTMSSKMGFFLSFYRQAFEMRKVC